MKKKVTFNRKITLIVWWYLRNALLLRSILENNTTKNDESILAYLSKKN